MPMMSMRNAGFVVLESLQRFVSNYIRNNVDASTTVTRLAVFPKRIYELSFHEEQVPSGLSVAYVALAAELNRQEAESDQSDDPVKILMRLIEAEVSVAMTNERRLTQFLSEIHENSDH